MSRYRALLCLLVFAACGSKPKDRQVAADSSVKSAYSKATPSGLGSLGRTVEVEIAATYAPRRSEELESAFILNAKVQDCLRLSLKTEPLNFEVRISGKLSFKGEVDEALIDSADHGLNSCLEAAMSSIQIGRGSIGPFHLRISRLPKRSPGQPPPPGVKSFFLSLEDVKKFQ